MRHLDEAASGTWSLSAADLKAGHTGTLQSWRVIVHGR
jgi:subtilisin-like proprotein convertase family protein